MCKEEENKEEKPKIEVPDKEIESEEAKKQNAMNNFLVMTILEGCSKLEEKFIDNAIIKIKGVRSKHKAAGKMSDPNFFEENDEILKNAINNFEKFKAIRSGAIKNGEIARKVNEKEKILGKGSNKFLNEVMGMIA